MLSISSSPAFVPWLKQLKSPEQVSRLRGKEVKFGRKSET